MYILVTQFIGHVELRKALWSARLQWETQSLQPSWSCTRLPQVLSSSYRPHYLIPSATHSQARREETSYKQSTLLPFQGKISLQHWFGAITDSLWYLSDSL